jgi:hypothetical protein
MRFQYTDSAPTRVGGLVRLTVREEEEMKLSTFLAVAGIVGVLFGLEFLLLPEFALKQYAVPTDPYNLMQARYFGATLMPYGLLLWLARKTRDDGALRAILQANVVAYLVGGVISVWVVLTGLQNQMAWSSVFIYGVFLLASLYFLSSPKRRA